MPDVSYYFALFKRFQIIGHGNSGISHGRSPNPTGGFDLKGPHAAFGNSNRGALLGATSNPAHSPLWAALNARVMGNPSPTVAGTTWPAMPLGNPLGWSDFQTGAPAPKLVDVFADWIAAGKVDDIPDDVIATVPAPIAGVLDSGVALFACSVAGDDGTRPGTVPPDFWRSSLIFLVDRRTGTTANPTELAAASEYWLTAVIGNRGDAAGGRMYYPPPPQPQRPKVEAAAWVMVWNTGTSPAVQLPALSNLDVNSTNGAYEAYFVAAGNYEVVGFRLNVQTAFDGLVRAIEASGTDLGGLTPEQWVHGQGAHLCVKVLVRQETESWPLLGDTPFTDRRLAQKNLAPFAIDLTMSSPDPNIVWRNFMVGDVLRSVRRSPKSPLRLGSHRLGIRAKDAEGFGFYLAIPAHSFKRWWGKRALDGFQIIDVERLPSEQTPPFPDHVVIAPSGRESWLEIPPLGKDYLGMSLGIEYRARTLRPGTLGEVSVVQQTATSIVEKGTEQAPEWVTVGGFTLRVSAHDSREDEKAVVSGY
jgi:hypothetical protein